MECHRRAMRQRNIQTIVMLAQSCCFVVVIALSLGGGGGGGGVGSLMITLHNVWFQKYSFVKLKVIWNLNGERGQG